MLVRHDEDEGVIKRFRDMGNGTWAQVIYAGSNTATDYAYAAAAGAIPGAMRIATLGNNLNIDTATQPEDVWAGAELGLLNGVDHRFIPLPATAIAMEVVSSSVSDASAGTGARTVAVGYLDSAYTAKSVIVTMNGTVPVAMPENVLRVTSMIVATNGTRGQNNTGNISIRAAGGLGATYSYMVAGIGIARNSLYTVPAGSSFDLLSLVLAINRTDTQSRWATYSVCIQNSAGRLIKGLELSCGSDTPYRHEAAAAPINTLAATTDIWVRCESVSQNSTNTTASLFGVQRNASPFGV